MSNQFETLFSSDTVETEAQARLRKAAAALLNLITVLTFATWVALIPAVMLMVWKAAI